MSEYRAELSRLVTTPEDYESLKSQLKEKLKAQAAEISQLNKENRELKTAAEEELRRENVRLRE
jgi:hypothetical protein